MKAAVPVKCGILLMADAHQNMLEGVRTLLADLFDAVVMVADGDSLLRVAPSVGPDLIIVDLSLPGLHSGSVLRALRRRDAAAPPRVIVLSVHDEAEAVREAFAAGATGYVLKRSAATDLIPAVHEALQDRIYVSPGVHTVPDRGGE